MTPTVAAASPTVAPASPFAAVSTAVHDREWWTEEAVRAGTDWSGLVAAALEMMIAAGIIEQPERKTMTTWDGPSWHASAKEYQEQRASRRTSETIDPERLAHLRGLMADDISIDHAWHELEADRTAPKATVDALMFSLRRGINELTQRSTLRRLSTPGENHPEDVCPRRSTFHQKKFSPSARAPEVMLLFALGRICGG